MTEMTTATKIRKAKAKAAAGPVPKTFERDLEVALTKDEVDVRKNELLAAMEREAMLRVQKSQATANVNAEIKLANKRVLDVAATLRSGKERKSVKCIERFIFDTNTVEVVRTDTGAVVEKRPMELHERQVSIPGVDAPKPGEPLTATVGEVAKAKRGRKAPPGMDGAMAASAYCTKVLDGKQCTRPANHRGAHGYRDPSPKA